ncbi:hypothetical protein [Methylobacterium isbiliense]|jgi:hypothetical protein|uniref:Uncharacterized protein n=1 Tax=Methylobacterium isbiliense TaxID=315478 RepID=A0ABQ4SAU7_9HYPH|nr:hypothetical protein [Methylobacterium isbiliense]MDN3623347.1 hypothetical protein [Methylobacterium isbiliense]GJE00097.1 hypothetical protein GMJLKIPL_2015 [Methylobacterium isbiliense]
MLRAQLFFGITVPSALLALIAQPLVEHSIEAMARPAQSSAQLVKGDRLAARLPARAPVTPVAVEITGLDAAKVTLRNAAGDIVYQADSTTNTTWVARDTAVPHVTLRARDGAPVVERKPTPPQPPATEIGTRQRMPEGCEGSISGLAGQEARRLRPSRCLAEAAPVVPAPTAG